MLIKKARPLTKNDFKLYGDVIEFAGNDFFHINDGQGERYHNIAQIDVKTAIPPSISLVRSQPVNLPVLIDMMERHPYASQAFVPIHHRRFLVAVAKAGETVNPDEIELFVTNGHQGVNYHAGVWHFPILALEDVTEMLVVDRAGSDNCDVIDLTQPFKLDV